MKLFFSDPKHIGTVSADVEENSLSAQLHQHDESEGSEFLDDALRMKEQPFENDLSDSKNQQ